MRRLAALLWLAVAVLSAAYLAVRIGQGLAFRTDLMALLPREQQDPMLQRADDAVTSSLSRRVVILIGASDRAAARDAAHRIADSLTRAGLADLARNGFDKDRIGQIGRIYFPYRRGLLSEADRQRLMEDRGEEIASRALSQVFGFVGMADGRLLARDPFLLMPDFLAGLPLPMSRLTLDDGMLSLQAEGKTRILLSGTLTGEPYALDMQKRLSATLDPLVAELRAEHPDLEVQRAGAVFFARAGAERAFSETTSISIASTLGTLLLVLVVFRALTPLWQTLLTIGNGVLVALAASLWYFGELHVGALLFGVSLIGVAVDYSLQYCSEVFAPGPPPPAVRLRRVFAGITLGAATTIIGYLTLMLAPFPGLHQIAAFSAVGLFASWATVVLWLPALDRTRAPRHGARMLAAAAWFLGLWEAPRYRRVRLAGLAGIVLIALFGLTRIHTDDDVRRMQSLSPVLVAEQERLQRLVGSTGGSQFLLVQAPDDDTALEREEILVERLQPLIGKGLAGFQSPAQYVPSAGRQRSNRALVHAHLDGTALREQTTRLGLTEPSEAADDGLPVMTLAEATKGGAFDFLSLLILETGGAATHVVTLDGVTDLPGIAAVVRGVPGVRLVDPAGDFSVLLGKYRNRALILLALSAALMAPLLALRYGWRGGLAVLAPPTLAVALAPALRAVAGGSFSFFDAMALVLILSIGVDYAVFCAETSGERKPVTMLAVFLAASTALLSFGLLALSGVTVVSAFGSTMTIGILAACLLSPMARGSLRTSTGGHWARFEERGSYLGIQFVASAYFLLGRRACMLMLWPVVGYFYITDPKRRDESLGYLARINRLKGLPPPATLDGLRHFMSFAEKALETFIAWARPKSSRIRVVGAEEIDRMAAEGHGGILIVSHIGNAELSRSGLVSRFGRDVNVLMHTKHAVQYNQLLHHINPASVAHTIEVTEIGPATAIDLEARVQRGEWIAIAGDRTPVFGGGRVSRVPFLGAPALFSQGPYILAGLMKCPVYLLFCLRDADGGHTAYFERFAERIDIPRRDKDAFLRSLTARYASRLEHYCLVAPMQWYNFFDFWAQEAPADGGGP
jgi:predicted exporter/predicted LPLAT superfamily acyltransferase